MKLSIIIVSWKSKNLLKKSLESIFRFAPDFAFEVIVVDNASADGTDQMLREMTRSFASHEPLGIPRVHGSLRMTINRENFGFAKANNQGIAQAKGEYVLLLNPDTEFIEDALSACVAKMGSDKTIGVLGCQLLNSDKTIQPSVRAFPRVRDIIVILLKLHKLFPSLLNKYLAKDFDYESPPNPLPSEYSGQALSKGGGSVKEVDQVMGAFFLVRKSVFDQIGLLDEKFFIWFEEVDFCRRAKQAGWNVAYYPGARIIHHVGQSFVKADTWRKQKWFFKSALLYFMK